MNLFVAGHGLNVAQYAQLAPALNTVADRYASLEDGQNFDWQCGRYSSAVACRFPSADSLGSRCYVAESAEDIVFYDGLPVDPRGRFPAHDAKQLARHWDESAADLDGFFCGLRLQKSSSQLEVQLDNFGVYGLYYRTEGDAWLISNSVGLLDCLGDDHDLDPDGVSRLLTMGWVAGNRTLQKNVRAFPAGERWTWTSGRTGPISVKTLDRRLLAESPKLKPSQLDAKCLASDLAQPLKSIGEHFTNVHCPLTGGKDSRVLAALLASNDVPARYYTYGNSAGLDSQIAAKVAAHLGVEHETLVTETATLLTNWEQVAKSFVMQGDGMCPLQLVLGAVSAQMVADQPVPVRIWGAGGELGRAFHFNPIQTVRGVTARDVQKTIARRWVGNANGLMRPEAYAKARSFVEDTIVSYADDGFLTDDLGDIFFLYERGGRRAGKNMRTNMSLRDSYSPFFSRSFVEAALSLDESARKTEPLHFKLLQELTPDLVKMPFDKGRWTSRSPRVNLYAELFEKLSSRLSHKMARVLPWVNTIEKKHILVKDTNFERLAWLQHIQKELREVCLDERNSAIWDYVDREKFSEATAASGNTDGLSRNAKGIFLTATLYYYDSQAKALRLNR